MSTLAIPTAADPIPRDWWREHALPAFDAMDDIDDVAESVRQAAALAKYVKDREQRFELDASRIVGETRIGELLGPPGKHAEITARGNLTSQDGTKFRQLAKHRKLVLKLLEQRIGSRRRILARVERDGSRPGRTGTLTEVRHGDFREVLDDLAGSVDAIVTDPPYPKEYLPLYADLSEMAARLLRPGGVCIVMVGHSYLPDVIQSLGQHLDYRWIIAYVTGGAAAAVHARRVQAYWKPVLVYEKPPSDVSHRIGGDVIRAPGGDTDPTYHGWGQNEAGMYELIKRVTEPEWLIVDPFLGGGTTLVAAARARRDAIGCDLDASAIQSAKERLV